MSDEEELEEFDFNDEDIKRAFNPNYRKHRMTKEEAMLGIWATNEYSDDDDDQKAEFKSNKKSTKKTNINFVSSGVTVKKEAEPAISTDQPKFEENDDNDLVNSSDEASDDDEENNGDKISSSMADRIILENLDEIEKEVKLTDKRPFSKTQKQSQPQHQHQHQQQHQQKNHLNKGKHTDQFVDKTAVKDIGNWEKYTKGIGMKLLQKMGWEKGKGIGKELQGRAIPVEAVVRKGKGAVGSYGPESKEARKAKDDEEDEENFMGESHVSQWRKDKKSKKPQYNLRTAEELLQMASNNPKKLKRIEQMLELNESKQSKQADQIIASSMTKIKIIDMTGKEQRVVHGYESLSQLTRQSKQDQDDENKKKLFDLPELTHNLDILVNLTEDKILNSDKKFKHYEDMIVSLTYEERRSKERIDVETEQIEKIKDLISIIEKCEKTVHQENISINDLIETFQNLQKDYPNEFIIFNLSQLVIPLMMPVLKRRMSYWRPFKDLSNNRSNEIAQANKLLQLLDGDEKCNEPLFSYEIYSDLKKLLNESVYNADTQQYMNPYHRLVWETWMPQFRRLLSELNIRKITNECVDLLNSWLPNLPSWIVENVIDQIVLPKLTQEVELWNPLTDTVPIHIWIHPWLPLMKDRLDSTVFPIIRYKLANALTNWHPSDLSAKAILTPWKPPAFNSNSWDTFVLKNILPKLELVLNDEFDINPREQNLEVWNWVMSWVDLIPLNNFVSMLERVFFPKWLQVLSVWLNSTPNYEEVSKWYVGWKTLFNEKLVQHANVKTKLSQALVMMSRSVSGSQVSYTTLDSQTQQAHSQSQQSQPRSLFDESDLTDTIKSKGLQSSINPSISSFKDIIERKATEHNIMFLPVLNRFKEGKQVYRFGNLNVYIDRNVVFMLQNGSWVPTSINEILQKAL